MLLAGPLMILNNRRIARAMVRVWMPPDEHPWWVWYQRIGILMVGAVFVYIGLGLAVPAVLHLFGVTR